MAAKTRVTQVAEPSSTGRTPKHPRAKLSSLVATVYSPPTAGLYYLAGYDSGLVQWVTWGPFTTPKTDPTAAQTTPNYTGSLSGIHVISGP